MNFGFKFLIKKDGLRSPYSIYKMIRRFSGGYSNPEEIRIPVAYGHIAGKAWGNPDGKPILGLHGWLDNAATHDNIAPLLPPGYRKSTLD